MFTLVHHACLTLLADVYVFMRKIFNIFVKKNHLPSSVALHFLFGLDPSFYGVLHFLDGQGFPTVALVEIGQ